MPEVETKEGPQLRAPKVFCGTPFVDCCAVLSTLVRRVAVSKGTWKLNIRTRLRRKKLQPNSLLRELFRAIQQVQSRRLDQYRVSSKHGRKKLPKWDFKALSVKLTMSLALYAESVIYFSIVVRCRRSGLSRDFQLKNLTARAVATGKTLRRLGCKWYSVKRISAQKMCVPETPRVRL